MEKLEDLSPPPPLPPAPMSPPLISLPSPPQFGSSSTSGEERLIYCDLLSGPGASFRKTTNGTSQENKFAYEQYVIARARASNGTTTDGFTVLDSAQPLAARKAPIRKISGGTFQQMKSAHEQYVFVIPRAAYQTTINGLTAKKDGERIPQEEAICRTCYKEFEEENALKVNCACPITLIHEHCAIVWSREKGSNKCDFCGQELENIPVALLPAKDFAQRPKRNLLKKWSCLCKG